MKRLKTTGVNAGGGIQFGGGGGRGGGGAMGRAMMGAFGSAEDLQAAFPGGFQQIQALFRVPGTSISAFGGGGGGGGFGFNQAPMAQTGTYLVTLKVGNETHRTSLRVEHVGPGDVRVVPVANVQNQ